MVFHKASENSQKQLIVFGGLSSSCQDAILNFIEAYFRHVKHQDHRNLQVNKRWLIIIMAWFLHANSKNVNLFVQK